MMLVMLIVYETQPLDSGLISLFIISPFNILIYLFIYLFIFLVSETIDLVLRAWNDLHVSIFLEERYDALFHQKRYCALTMLICCLFL